MVCVLWRQPHRGARSDQDADGQGAHPVAPEDRFAGAAARAMESAGSRCARLVLRCSKSIHFLIHMQQVREILEPETAALAATHRTDEQMAEIEDAFAAMAEAKTLIAWNNADVLFHQAILLAAGNELLVPLGLVIESALGNMFNYTASHRGDIGRTLPGHERILLAIRGRKPNAARLAVRQLLRDTGRVVEQVTSSASTLR